MTKKTLDAFWWFRHNVFHRNTNRTARKERTMSQKRKTPKYLAEMIQRHADYVDYAEERIRVKTTVPVENQAEHIQRVTVAEIEGQVTGYWVALEAALMAYGCYAGFMYVGEKKRENGANCWISVKPDHPEFREWRRHYFTR
jgi:hypothetical protein